MHNRIHTVFFTPLFYMYYTLLTPPLESTKKKKKKKQKKKKKKRDTPLYTFDQKNHFALFDTLNIRLCVCVLFSLSSLCLSFFLESELYPIHSFARALCFWVVSLSREEASRRATKKREEAYRRPRRTDSESSFFLSLYYERKERHHI